MEDILIFGAGPHAEVVIDIIEDQQKYRIAGIVDSVKDIGAEIHGYKVIGRQDNLISLCSCLNLNKGIVCIGDNWSRMKVAKQILSMNPNFGFVSAIHPKATISKKAIIGRGCVIMPGVSINTNAIMGDFCIVNTNSSLEHYCKMGNYSSLSAGVTTGGFINIGRCSAIALGATIFDRVNIGTNVVVGSNALVTKDVPDNVLVYGVPATIIGERKIGERFLK